MAERRTQIFSENVNSSGTQNDVVSMQQTIMETNAATVSNEKFHRGVAAPVVSNRVDSIEVETATTTTKPEMMVMTTLLSSPLSTMASTNDGIFVDNIEESRQQCDGIRKNINIDGGGGGTCSSASSGIGLSMEENSICDITKNPHKYCINGGKDGVVNNSITAGNLNPNMATILNDDMDGGGSICSSSGIGGGNSTTTTINGNGDGGGNNSSGIVGGNGGGSTSTGSNGINMGKNKGKRRRRKAKQKSNNIKPYKKSNWKFRPIRVRTAERRNGESMSTGSVRLLSTLVPYNTNKFLMEEHMPQLPSNGGGIGGGTGGRTRDSSFSIDESEDYFNALPEDEEEFLTKEFSSVYEDARAERLDGMSKNQLIREYLQMEANYDKLSKNLGERKCFDDSVKEQQLARTLEWEQIIGRLEEKVKQLTDENLDLRRKMADICNRGHRSNSPRKGKIISNHHHHQHQHHHHNHHFHPYHHQNGNTTAGSGNNSGVDNTNHQVIMDRMQENCNNNSSSSSSSSADSDSDSTDTDSSNVGDSRSSDDSSAVDQDSHSSLSDEYTNNDGGRGGGGGDNNSIVTSTALTTATPITPATTIQNHHHLNGVR